MQFHRKTGAWVIAATAIAASSGCGHSDSSSTTRATTVDLAQRYAPVIAVHRAERWLPISASEFVASSVLRWHDRACGDQALASGPRADPPRALARLRPAKLGGNVAAPYAVRAPGPPQACDPGKRFTTSDYTRPYDPLRANDIRLDAGFVLDLHDRRRGGDPPRADGRLTAPAYWDAAEEGDRLRITYWLLFGMELRPGPSDARALAHEGDWERVSVLIHRDGDQPVSLRVNDVEIDTPWRALDLHRTAKGTAARPIVYAARGRHKLYVKPGTDSKSVSVAGRAFELVDTTTSLNESLRWDTAARLLRARSQPWYGYGGAWGTPLGSGMAAGGLGPSRWTDVEPWELQ